jgi:Ras GTPase-activating-like protein IQGAP2/3
MQTKRCVLYIIRVQTGTSLVEILCKQPSEEDEHKWSQLLHEEMPSQKNRTPYAEALFYDLAEYLPPPRTPNLTCVECRMQS